MNRLPTPFGARRLKSAALAAAALALMACARGNEPASRTTRPPVNPSAAAPGGWEAVPFGGEDDIPLDSHALVDVSAPLALTGVDGAPHEMDGSSVLLKVAPGPHEFQLSFLRMRPEQLRQLAARWIGVQSSYDWLLSFEAQPGLRYEIRIGEVVAADRDKGERGSWDVVVLAARKVSGEQYLKTLEAAPDGEQLRQDYIKSREAARTLGLPAPDFAWVEAPSPEIQWRPARSRP